MEFGRSPIADVMCAIEPDLRRNGCRITNQDWLSICTYAVASRPEPAMDSLRAIERNLKPSEISSRSWEVARCQSSPPAS